MFTFEIDSENALVGCTLGTLGPRIPGRDATVTQAADRDGHKVCAKKKTDWPKLDHQQSGQCIFCILEMTFAYFAYRAYYFAYFAYCMQY